MGARGASACRVTAAAFTVKRKSTSVTIAGAIIMIVSVSAVLALTTFCVVHVLRLPPVEMEDIKGPLAIDTGDTADAD